MFLITCPPARPWCVNRMRDHHILPEDKVAPVMGLDGMDDSINDKNDSQIVEEIADIKDSILNNINSLTIFPKQIFGYV